MLRAKSICGFVLRFALATALLLAPWPGLREAYAKFFRAGGETFLDALGSRSYVRFQPDLREPANWDTLILLANRDLRDAAGQTRAAGFRVNSRSVGYVPTALVLALILATRLPWRRRAWALGWGLVLVHIYIAFLLTLVLFYMQCENPWLGLGTPTPLWRQVISGLNDLFLTTFQGRRYAVALLIWMLVCFRREDLAKLLEGIQHRTSPSRPHSASCGSNHKCNR